MGSRRVAGSCRAAADGPVPVVQLSLIPHDFDANVRLGGALACLREEGVVILASGSITHDQHEFRRGFLSNFGFETAMDGSLASKRKWHSRMWESQRSVLSLMRASGWRVCSVMIAFV